MVPGRQIADNNPTASSTPSTFLSISIWSAPASCSIWVPPCSVSVSVVALHGRPNHKTLLNRIGQVRHTRVGLSTNLEIRSSPATLSAASSAPAHGRWDRRYPGGFTGYCLTGATAAAFTDRAEPRTTPTSTPTNMRPMPAPSRKPNASEPDGGASAQVAAVATGSIINLNAGATGTTPSTATIAAGTVMKTPMATATTQSLETRPQTSCSAAGSPMCSTAAPVQTR